MQWLDAILAFSITMLVLSMVTTTIVETIHRIGGLREAGFKLMMSHVYDQVIVPYLKKAGIEGTAETSYEAFRALMTKTISPQNPQNDPDGDGIRQGIRASIAGAFSKFTKWLVRIEDVAHLDTEKFFERLGASEFGKAIEDVSTAHAKAAAPKGKAAATADGQPPANQLAITDVGRKFETIGAEASAYFEKRARLLSVLVAFVVAWVFYVNPYTILVTYLNNPTVTAKVIAQGEAVLQEFDQTQNVKVPPADAAALQSAIKEARANVEKLSTTGVPIGWTAARLEKGEFTTSPICVPDVITMLNSVLGTGTQRAQDPNCWKNWFTLFTMVRPTAITPDFLWLILGGFLVGLGAPFWASSVRSIMNIRKTLRGGGSKKTDGQMAEDNEGNEEYLKTLVTIFNSARDAAKLLGPPEQKGS